MAEGQRQAAIKQAEGEKQAQILRAEAKQQALVLEAQGGRQAQILDADGRAQAIASVYGAITAAHPTSARSPSSSSTRWARWRRAQTPKSWFRSNPAVWWGLLRP